VKDHSYVEKKELSMEMLEFQKNPIFFKELKNLIEDFKGKKREDLFELKFTDKLNSIIKHHTQLKAFDTLIGIKSKPEEDIVSLCILNNLNSLVEIKNLTFGFSYKTGYFTGDTKKLYNRLLVPPEWIIGDYFTSGELAAGILHEIGHLAFRVNFLARQIKTNIALLEVVKELRSGQPPSERVSIFRRAANEAELKNLNIAELAGIDDPEVITVIFTNSLLNDYRSELGSGEYDRTMEEYYADMYAVRCGAGTDLASIAVKMETRYGPSFTTNELVRIAGGLSIAASVAAAVVAPVVMPISILLSATWILGITATFFPSNSDYIYDDALTRITRIRQQLSSALQNKRLSKFEVEQLTAMLAELDSNIKSLKKDTNVFDDFLLKLFNKTAKRRLKAQEIQNEYEALAYNKLFEKSAVLRVI